MLAQGLAPVLLWALQPYLWHIRLQKKENGCRTKRKEEAESFSKKHVKVTSVAWQPHATLYATLLFFRPTPSWLSPGRYTRSTAAKR